MKPHRWTDYITLNSLWLGLNSVSQSLNPLILPLLIQQYVGENLQGTYFGRIRLWSLMVAILAQAIFGAISDKFTSPFGKRKPFILAGLLGLNIVIPLIGLTRNLSGTTGFWVLFTLVLILMVFANMAHGALQGLIPDLVPQKLFGRYSGIKAFFEVPLPVVIVSLTIAKMIGNGNFWGSIIVLLVILDIAGLISLFVPERTDPKTKFESFNWRSYIPLFFMTGAFTVVILSTRQLLLLVELLAASLEIFPKAVLFTITGTILMIAAIVIGVNISIRIGLGAKDEIKTNFKRWVINRLMFLVALTNLVSFFVYFLQAKLHLSGESAILPASNLIRYVGIFIAVSVLPSGWLADRYSKKVLIAISSFLAFSGALVVILANSMNPLYIGGVLLGISAGLFYSVNWAFGTKLVPKEESGKYLGISNLAGAGAIGAFIGGPIADYFTPGFHV
ncbi:MAG: MFS transporter [Anaerolineaceae bacterium]|nr:MFS transporter [Anaerolineaceae bacterium]